MKNGLPVLSITIEYQDKTIINQIPLTNFTIQLGMTKEPYGFNAILGVDFCETAGLILDFKNLLIRT